MAKKGNLNEILADERIILRDVVDEMEEASLNYAIKTIIDRALPDVRDGLKPAQRRILYGMHDLGMTPDKPYRKSANVTGHVMAKYHPHGDSYGVLVNMANDLGIRYPVVDGQGNFGHPLDGDGPAAARYTETRLSKIGLEMLRDVDKRVVDFKPNYSEETEEPTVLPAAVPFLLINGASGIATGYTTEIPSHNLGEVVDALLALIEDPNLKVRDLMKYIKGPDLPTGGYLIESDEILKLYETGKGSIKFRAKIITEVNEEGNTQIVITELPPDVKKASVDKSSGIVEKLYQLCVQDKKIPRVVDVRDESTGKRDKKTGKVENSVRIVIELHKTAIPELVIAELYRQTALEKTKSYVLRAVVNQAPTILNLKDMLNHYLNHRHEVVFRRIQWDLDKARKRLHLVEGFKTVFIHLNDVIDTIRTYDDPTDRLMTRYGLSNEQVKAILDMSLRRLSKMEENKIDIEINELISRIGEYERILGDRSEIDKVIVQELKDIKKRFGDPRKTTLISDTELNANISTLLDEPMVTVLTNKNGIKQVPENAMMEMLNSGTLRERTEVYVQGIKCRASDEFVLILETGEYVRCGFNDLIGDMDFLEGKRIVGLFTTKDDGDEGRRRVVVVTRKGMIKKTKVSGFKARLRRVAPYIRLGDGDAIVGVRVIRGDDLGTIVLATRKGIIHRFYERSFSITNPGGEGIPCISPSVIEEGDEVVDFDAVNGEDDERGLVILYIVDADGTYKVKAMSAMEFKPKGRVTRGITAVHKGFNGTVHKVRVAYDDFTIVDKRGIVHKQELTTLKIQGRYERPREVKFTPLTTRFFLE